MVEEFKHYLKQPHWRRQHRWRRAIFRTMSRLGLIGTHALPMNRRWVDIHRCWMPLRNLDPCMEGLRVIQISDLHYSPVVWHRYLVQYVRWVNELNPDVVVVTGDLITGGYHFARRVAKILALIRSRHGVICTLGNHDYSMYGKFDPQEGERRADFLEKSLRAEALDVLRNETRYLKINGAQTPLAIVGLDDEWTRHLDAPKAWKGVDAQLPIICLNHNPANVLDLLEYPWQWMLAGHTHGRALSTSRIGQALYPRKFRHYTHGHYRIGDRHLYVNRGLSYGQRVLHWCRPEITVFKLRRAD